jgi:site-specific DNA-methyltransferase (adenine-specific)
MRELLHERTERAFTGLGGRRVFCNPPYGTEIKKWVEKAYREGTKDNTVVVLLIPARTDTQYFHDYIIHRSEIRFVRGRLKFGDSKTCAPFPSMVVIFRGAGM